MYYAILRQQYAQLVHASISANTSNPIFALARYAHATQVALASLGVLPNFDPLQEFRFHLEETDATHP